MNTNRSVIIGLFIFWAMVVALLVAGFISAENNKLINEIRGNSNNHEQSNQIGVNNQKEILSEQIIEEGQESQNILLDAIYVNPHNSVDDCWLTIFDEVYDVTEYIPLHPGGTETIANLCGGDGTQGFTTKGEKKPENHSDFAYKLLESYHVGSIGEVIGTMVVNTGTQQSKTSNVQKTEVSKNIILKPTPLNKVADNTPIDTTPEVVTKTQDEAKLTVAAVAKHNIQSNCWMVMDGNVYDFSAYISLHPGGTGTILPYCGADGTNAFNNEGHSNAARNLFANYFVGIFTIDATTPSTTNQTTSSPTSVTGYPAINASFPGATILDVEAEDDGRVKLKIRYDGDTYKIKLDSQGNITDVEEDD